MAKTKTLAAIDDSDDSKHPPLPAAPGRGMKPDVFWKYWQQCETAAPQRVYAYLYRAWPKIDTKLANEKADQNIDKLLFCSREEIRARHGSGVYKLILKDPFKNVGRSDIGTTLYEDRHEEAEFPPILDLRTLLVNDPANQTYVRSLRAKGVRLPGDNPQEQQEQEEMKIAETLLTHVLKAGGQGNPTAAVDQATSIISGAAQKSNEMIIGLTQRMAEMAMDKNPVSQMKELVELTRAMQPPPPPALDLSPILAQMQAQHAQVSALVMQLAERPRPTDDDDEPMGLEGTVRLLRKVEQIKAQLGVDGGGGLMRDSSWEKLLTVVQPLVPIAALWLQNKLTSPAVSPAVSPAAPTAPPPPPPDPLLVMVDKVAGPLARFLSDGELTGADFAHVVVAVPAWEWHGREVYEGVKSVGADALTQAILRHPQLSLFPPAAVAEFVGEFMRYDEALADDSAPVEPPATTTTTAAIETAPAPVEVAPKPESVTQKKSRKG